jgi:hypothetical protein
MKLMTSPWLDVVVIAPPLGQSGISAQLVNARRNNGGAQVDRTVFNDLETWCLLPAAAIPESSDEVVFKLSRHVVDGATLTWLGVYRYARFPRNPRRYTYIGLGVLTCNGVPPIAEAVSYLTEYLQMLLEANDEVSQSAGELADILRQEIPPFAVQTRRGAGLSAHADDKLYMDLSSAPKNELKARLNGALELALTDQSFTGVSEILVGATRRLVQSVAQSHAYLIADQRGRPPAPPQRAPERQDRPSRAQADPGPHRKSQTREWEGGPPDTRDPDVIALQARLEQLELWARKTDGRLAKRSDRQDSGVHQEEKGRSYFAPIMALAFVILIGLISALGYMAYNSYTADMAAPAESPSSDSSTVVASAASSPNQDVCPQADLNNRSIGDVEKIKTERRCLEREAERISERIQELRSAEAS